eukprot:475302-Pyramimonas_sp.AAC.1
MLDSPFRELAQRPRPREHPIPLANYSGHIALHDALARAGHEHPVDQHVHEKSLAEIVGPNKRK